MYGLTNRQPALKLPLRSQDTLEVMLIAAYIVYIFTYGILSFDPVFNSFLKHFGRSGGQVDNGLGWVGGDYGPWIKDDNL